MTTTMRLPLSMARDAKGDDSGILERRRAELRAQRSLAMRGVGAFRDWRALAHLHIGLLPDDVVDTFARERIIVGEMHRIAKTKSRVQWHFAPALVDAKAGEKAGHDLLVRETLPPRRVPIVAFEVERRRCDMDTAGRLSGEARPERREWNCRLIADDRVPRGAEVDVEKRIERLRIRISEHRAERRIDDERHDRQCQHDAECYPAPCVARRGEAIGKPSRTRDRKSTRLNSSH